MQIEVAPDRGTVVQLIKQFSKQMSALSAIELNKLVDKLARQIPEDPYAEIQQQNQ